MKSLYALNPRWRHCHSVILPTVKRPQSLILKSLVYSIPLPLLVDEMTA